MNLAELSHGAVRRGRQTVLQPGTTPLPVRGVAGIVGLNGAGKSTLFHALAGTLARGFAVIRGGGASPPTAIAYAPQQSAFPAWLDVADAVRLHGVELDDLARRAPGLLLEELAGMAVPALSAGQRQALSVGIALAADSTLTLLDEPFAPLDFRRRLGLVRLLRARRADDSGGLTLVSSQSAADLLDTCAWIVVLRDGRYVFSGATDSLTAGIADPAGARQRFEERLVALLGAASPPRLRAGSRPLAVRVAGT